VEVTQRSDDPWTYFFGAHPDPVTIARAHAAGVKILSTLRMVRTRRLYLFVRTRLRAARLIQRAWRLAAARRAGRAALAAARARRVADWVHRCCAPWLGAPRAPANAANAANAAVAAGAAGAVTVATPYAVLRDERACEAWLDIGLPLTSAPSAPAPGASTAAAAAAIGDALGGNVGPSVWRDRGWRQLFAFAVPSVARSPGAAGARLVPAAPPAHAQRYVVVHLPALAASPHAFVPAAAAAVAAAAAATEAGAGPSAGVVGGAGAAQALLSSAAGAGTLTAMLEAAVNPHCEAVLLLPHAVPAHVKQYWFALLAQSLQRLVAAAAADIPDEVVAPVLAAAATANAAAARAAEASIAAAAAEAPGAEPSAPDAGAGAEAPTAAPLTAASVRSAIAATLARAYAADAIAARVRLLHCPDQPETRLLHTLQLAASAPVRPSGLRAAAAASAAAAAAAGSSPPGAGVTSADGGAPAALAAAAAAPATALSADLSACHDAYTHFYRSLPLAHKAAHCPALLAKLRAVTAGRAAYVSPALATAHLQPQPSATTFVAAAPVPAPGGGCAPLYGRADSVYSLRLGSSAAGAGATLGGVPAGAGAGAGASLSCLSGGAAALALELGLPLLAPVSVDAYPPSAAVGAVFWAAGTDAPHAPVLPVPVAASALPGWALRALCAAAGLPSPLSSVPHLCSPPPTVGEPAPVLDASVLAALAATGAVAVPASALGSGLGLGSAAGAMGSASAVGGAGGSATGAGATRRLPGSSPSGTAALSAVLSALTHMITRYPWVRTWVVKLDRCGDTRGGAAFAGLTAGGRGDGSSSGGSSDCCRGRTCALPGHSLLTVNAHALASVRDIAALHAASEALRRAAAPAAHAASKTVAPAAGAGALGVTGFPQTAADAARARTVQAQAQALHSQQQQLQARLRRRLAQLSSLPGSTAAPGSPGAADLFSASSASVSAAGVSSAASASVLGSLGPSAAASVAATAVGSRAASRPATTAQAGAGGRSFFAPAGAGAAGTSYADSLLLEDSEPTESAEPALGAAGSVSMAMVPAPAAAPAPSALTAASALAAEPLGGALGARAHCFDLVLSELRAHLSECARPASSACWPGGARAFLAAAGGALALVHVPRPVAAAPFAAASPAASAVGGFAPPTAALSGLTIEALVEGVIASPTVMAWVSPAAAAAASSAAAGAGVPPAVRVLQTGDQIFSSSLVAGGLLAPASLPIPPPPQLVAAAAMAAGGGAGAAAGSAAAAVAATAAGYAEWRATETAAQELHRACLAEAASAIGSALVCYAAGGGTRLATATTASTVPRGRGGDASGPFGGGVSTAGGFFKVDFVVVPKAAVRARGCALRSAVELVFGNNNAASAGGPGAGADAEAPPGGAAVFHGNFCGAEALLYAHGAGVSASALARSPYAYVPVSLRFGQSGALSVGLLARILSARAAVDGALPPPAAAAASAATAAAASPWAAGSIATRAGAPAGAASVSLHPLLSADINAAWPTAGLGGRCATSALAGVPGLLRAPLPASPWFVYVPCASASAPALALLREPRLLANARAHGLLLSVQAERPTGPAAAAAEQQPPSGTVFLLEDSLACAGPADSNALGLLSLGGAETPATHTRLLAAFLAGAGRPGAAAAASVTAAVTGGPVGAVSSAGAAGDARARALALSSLTLQLVMKLASALALDAAAEGTTSKLASANATARGASAAAPRRVGGTDIVPRGGAFATSGAATINGANTDAGGSAANANAAGIGALMRLWASCEALLSAMQT
jgi:hypothetical protein